MACNGVDASRKGGGERKREAARAAWEDASESLWAMAAGVMLCVRRHSSESRRVFRSLWIANRHSSSGDASGGAAEEDAAESRPLSCRSRRIASRHASSSNSAAAGARGGAGVSRSSERRLDGKGAAAAAASPLTPSPCGVACGGWTGMLCRWRAFCVRGPAAEPLQRSAAADGGEDSSWMPRSCPSAAAAPPATGREERRPMRASRLPASGVA